MHKIALTWNEKTDVFAVLNHCVLYCRHWLYGTKVNLEGRAKGQYQDIFRIYKTACVIYRTRLVILLYLPFCKIVESY